MRIIKILTLTAALAILLCGCSQPAENASAANTGNAAQAASNSAGNAAPSTNTANTSPANSGAQTKQSYTQIDQETAAKMMSAGDGHVVVDVRRQDEYDAGHIPGAILIPNESIGTERPKELADLGQTILIYCRSGNRSKQAAEKLAAMGYTNIYEFGGIIDWKGEIVKTQQTAIISFESFDGGGPNFNIAAEDAGIVSWESVRNYPKADHDNLTGAGYTVSFTFTGLKPGSTRLTVQERSPIADNLDHIYDVAVDSDLNVALTLVKTVDINGPEVSEPRPMILIETEDDIFYAVPEDNSSAQEFVEKLSEGPITVDMHDYGSFEKVGPLPWTLPRNDEQITTVPGDVILYQGNQITIYYAQNSWSFTRLAKIENATRKKLLEAFGSGNVTITFSVEWTE